jgi:Tfp pilus assembly protein PilF
MRLFNAIDGLNEVFEDTCVKQVILGLTRNPLIWNFLGDVQNFNHVRETLSNDPSRWTITGIIESAANLLFEVGAKEKLKNSLESGGIMPEINDLSELSALSLEVKDFIRENSFALWLENLPFQTATEDDLWSWAAILSVIFPGFDNPIDSLSEFTNEEHFATIKLLAYSIHSDQVIVEFLLDNLNGLCTNKDLIWVVALINHLDYLGDFEISKKIAEVYFERCYSEITKIPISEIRFEDLLKRIAENRNLIFISQKAEHNAVTDELYKIGKELLSKLLNETGISNYDPAIFEKFSGFQNELNVEHNTNSILQEKINSAYSFLPTDPKVSKSIANEVFSLSKRLLQGNNSHLEFRHSQRQKIIDLLQTCNLIVECANLIDQFVFRYPYDIWLLRIAAIFFHTHGNHAKAVRNFQLLNVLDTLSREEKVLYAESLAYMENFHLAYEVRTLVNTLDIKDTKTLLCFALNAGLQEEVDKILEQNQKDLGEWPLIHFLSQEYMQSGNQIDGNLEQIWYSLSTNEDKILFINQLEKTDKTSIVPGFLEKLHNDSADFSRLTIKLVQYYQESGDHSLISETLSKVQLIQPVSQKELEEGTELLIQNGLTEKASQWLKLFENTWRLSPIKNLMQAEISLHEGNFIRTEQLLREEIFNQEVTEKSLGLYSLALLNTHPKRFPIGLNIEKIALLKVIEDKFKRNLDFSDITLRILRIYLNGQDRIILFEKEFSAGNNFDNNDAWRIKAAIANEYFNQAQYDLAIQYFREVERILPFDSLLLRNLLECYLRLKLTEEAELILHRLLAVENLPLKDLICLSFDQLLSEEWISFLHNQNLKFPDSKEIQLLFAISSCRRGNYAGAIESAKNILLSEDLNVDEKLIAAQVLAASGNHILAERVIEILFSGSKDLGQVHYLVAALIYQKIENYSKALIMLNHLQPFDRFLSGFKMDLMIKNGNKTDALKYLQEMNLDPDYVYPISNDLPLIDASTWQLMKDDKSFFERIAASVWVANKDISSGLQVLVEGFKQDSSDEQLALQVLETAKLAGCMHLLDDVLRIFDGKEINSSRLICSLGESALMRDQELLAAHYLSKIIDINENQLRTRALQSIMLKRNGNVSDAKWLYSDLRSEIHLNNSATDNTSDILENHLWLVNLAYEMDDFSIALDISRDEITKFGQVSGLVDIYLKSLLSLLRQNILFENLNSSSKVRELSDEQLSLFNLIEKEIEENGFSEFDNRSYRLCKTYLDKEYFDIDKFVVTESTGPDLRDLLYLSILKNGYEKTAFEFTDKLKNQQDLIFFAAIVASEDPEKSLELIQDHVNLLSNDPIHLALLTKIHFMMENYSEAYAAISLALEIEPEEYGWQILAGEISQKKGDMIAAIDHFERANRLSKKSSLTEQLNGLHILSGSEQAIPLMESKFADDSGNADLAIKIASLCLNFNKPGKASYYFGIAIKLNPKDHQPFIGLSRLSAQMGNFNKALEYVDVGLRLCERNLDLLLLKTDLIKRTIGLNEAKGFLEKQVLLNDEVSGELQASLADLIYEMYGLDECLAFITSKDFHDHHSAKFMITRVKYLLIAGDKISAKESLEKTLNVYPDNAEVNSLMGEYYRIQGGLDQAIGHYLRAINLDPANERYFINLFEIYNDQRNSESAVETLRSGMKAIPYSIALPIRLAKFYLQHGLNEMANEMIERVLRLRPRDEEAEALRSLINHQRVTMNHEIEMYKE